MFNGLNITGSGMSMAKKWMEVTSNNISNINTNRGEDGNPYRRQTVVLESKSKFEDKFNENIGNGVQIKEIVHDRNEELIHNPDHPDANDDGYVRMPNINLTAEMTNLMVAEKAYGANVSAYNANKKIMEKELEIGRF